MVFLLIKEDTGNPLTSDKMTKKNLMHDLKNKGTLFSLTLKVEEITVHMLS